MSDTTDTPRERKPLGLKRSIDAGEVKQTFSHGRTNKVVVEVKRRRVLGKPGEAPATPEPEEVVVAARVKLFAASGAAGYEVVVYRGLAARDKELHRLGATSESHEKVAAAVGYPKLEDFLAALESTAFATWDEAELLTAEMLTAAGTADAERLGVRPRRMADVLGA